MAPSADNKTVPKQQQMSNNEQEAAMNIGLSNSVVELHEQLASQMDLCNNLLAQFASIRRISSTPYGAGGGRVPLVKNLALRNLHPNWTNRLKVRLHSSLSECVENLRQFSAERLPALARQFDRAQSSTKDDVSLLVADFEFSLAVDSARPGSSLVDRYTFETDDRALVAAHLRRLAIRLDAELDRLTNLVSVETGGNGEGFAGETTNGAKMRRQSFALRGSTKSSSHNNNSSNGGPGSTVRWSISLEPCLMLVDSAAATVVGAAGAHVTASAADAVPSFGGAADVAGGGTRPRAVSVLPDWSVELALGRLSTGGGRCF